MNAKTLTKTQRIIRESSIIEGRGEDWTQSGRKLRHAVEAKGSVKRQREAKRLRKVRKVARDARTLEAMAGGCAYKRALRQEAFTGRKLEASTVEEMGAIYRARFARAYVSTGTIPNLGKLFARAKSIIRLTVAPTLATAGMDAAAVLAASDAWEVRQMAREGRGETRERGRKVKVCLSRVEGPAMAGDGVCNPYSFGVRLAWARAVWGAARQSVAEGYKGNREADRTVSSDELRGLAAALGNVEAAEAEASDVERVALLREETTARAVETYGDGDGGARRVDTRRHVAHARRCILAHHLQRGGRQCMSEILADLDRLARLTRVLRGESYSLLSAWCGGDAGDLTGVALARFRERQKKEFGRLRKRLGVGDLILSGDGADAAEAAIAAWEMVRAGSRRMRAPLALVVTGDGWLSADALTVASAQVYAIEHAQRQALATERERAASLAIARREHLRTSRAARGDMRALRDEDHDIAEARAGVEREAIRAARGSRPRPARV